MIPYRLKKIMGKLVFTCIKATELVEKRQVAGLTTYESIKLSSHLSMCRACRSYEKQSVLMERLLDWLLESSNTGGHVLDEPSKERIYNRIKDIG